MKKWLLLSIVGLVSVFIIAGCTPPAAPTLAPMPVAPQVAPAVPTPASPAISTEEAAWAKIVQAARKEGKLTVYNYSFIGDIGLAIAKAFEDRYGIKVDWIAGRGAEFLERLKVEQRMGRLVADVVEGNPPHIRNMQLQGLTAASTDLPVLRQKDVWAVDIGVFDSKGHLLGYTMYFFTPVVNTRLVKPADEPRSLMDLLEPRWKGKKIVEKDPRISTGLYDLLSFIRHEMLSPDFIERLSAQDLYLVRSSFEEISAVARGDVWATIKTNPIHASAAVKEGAPIKGLEMREGHLVNMLGISAVGNAPRPNAAKVFLNWLFSEEGQLVHGKAAGATSVRKDVPDFLPETLRLKPKKFYVRSVEDDEAVSKAFREKTLEKYFIK